MQNYAICNGYNLRFIRSEKKKIDARCDMGCSWRLYASEVQNEYTFVINTMVKEHKCFRALRNRQANSEWIAKEFLEKIKMNPHLEVKEMNEYLKDKYALSITRNQLYKEKWKALHILRGFLKDHYQKLRPYKAELMKNYREGVFEFYLDIKTCPMTPIFKRFYIGSSYLRKDFLSCCRSFLGFDGTFLKTFLGGQMFPIF